MRDYILTIYRDVAWRMEGDSGKAGLRRDRSHSLWVEWGSGWSGPGIKSSGWAGLQMNGRAGLEMNRGGRAGLGMNGESIVGLILEMLEGGARLVLVGMVVAGAGLLSDVMTGSCAPVLTRSVLVAEGRNVRQRGG